MVERALGCNPISAENRRRQAARIAGASSFTTRVWREDGEPVMTHLLSLTPFRRVIRDYEMICESYFNAIRTASPTQIEAIDTGIRY